MYLEHIKILNAYSLTHKAKTWLLDPRAPKIDPPAAVQMLKEEGM